MHVCFTTFWALFARGRVSSCRWRSSSLATHLPLDLSLNDTDFNLDVALDGPAVRAKLVALLDELLDTSIIESDLLQRTLENLELSSELEPRSSVGGVADANESTDRGGLGQRLEGRVELAVYSVEGREEAGSVWWTVDASAQVRCKGMRAGSSPERKLYSHASEKSCSGSLTEVA